MDLIWELEIVSQIMYLLRKLDVGFYQREISYSHCDVTNQLEDIKGTEGKQNASLSVGNGDYLIPLLENLRKQNEIYYMMAVETLFHQICLQCNSEIINAEDSVFGQLFSWVRAYTFAHQNQEKVDLENSQMLKQFATKLESWIEDSRGTKKKQK